MAISDYEFIDTHGSEGGYLVPKDAAKELRWIFEHDIAMIKTFYDGAVKYYDKNGNEVQRGDNGKQE